MLKIVVRILLYKKERENKISCLWVARCDMDAECFNNSLDSSSQVTWREGLSQFRLGFYTKAGTLR